MVRHGGRGLARPALSDGPLKNLNDALHELHRRAGRPSLRELEADIKAEDSLPVPPSHTRIYDVFSKARVPDSSLLCCLALVIARRGHALDTEIDPGAEPDRFYRMWLAADAAERQATYDSLAPDPVTAAAPQQASAVPDPPVPPLTDSPPAPPPSDTSSAPPRREGIAAMLRRAGASRRRQLSSAGTAELPPAAGLQPRHDRQLLHAMLPHPLDSRAVFIGTSAYDTLPELPSVQNGLLDLCGALTSQYGTFHPSNARTVLNPGSVTEALAPLEEAASEAADTLVLYLAGHGLLDSYDGELSLGMVSSRPGVSYTALPYNWVRELIANSPARRRIVIMDCCFSGSVLHTMGAEDLAPASAIEGTYLITSTSPTARAMAPAGQQYTAFTGELLRILSAGIPGGPEVLDLDLIYQHLNGELARQGLPRPQRQDRNGLGRLGLALNPAAGPTG
ncbi:caspase domain-containing protein [Streptomyces sp. NPDC053560]|uniref:caspase domain-containing protein n=1 Tax=Streptomyces sp. NPDC053560 TaxID=3365711 RepID=UPI0037D79627